MEIKINQLKPHPDNSKIYGVENVDELAAQIEQSGWIKPLVVTDFYGGYTIVSGHRRHAAALKLAWDIIPCEVEHFEAEWQIMERLLLENDNREKTTLQRTREFSARKVVEAERAKWYKLSKLKQNADVEIFPQREEGKSRDIAAEQSGFGSGKTAEAAEDIVQAIDELEAQGEEEKADLLKQSLEQKNVSGTKAILDFIEGLSKEDAAKYADDLKAGRKTVTQVRRIIEAEQRRAGRTEDLQDRSADLPSDIFQVIYCDPAWQYSNSGLNGAAANHYMTMPTEEMAKIDVKGIADINAVCFMWATNPLLEDAIWLMKQWGFEYKTNLVWVKNKSNYGKLGFYVYGQHELLLIGVKGSMLPTGEKPKSIIYGDNSKHSKKPEGVYELIESMYPGLKYVELFSRNLRQGWTMWGNQIDEQ